MSNKWDDMDFEERRKMILLWVGAVMTLVVTIIFYYILIKPLGSALGLGSGFLIIVAIFGWIFSLGVYVMVMNAGGINLNKIPESKQHKKTFCTSCGESIKKTSKFCDSCGEEQ